MSRLCAVLATHGTEVWQADQLGAAVDEAASVCSTGFAALDAELPGGGWPLGALVELLQTQPGLHEWQLLLPALSRLTSIKPVLLVGAPHTRWQPFGPGLAARGLAASRLLWVDSVDTAGLLWAAEQGLRCADLAAVLAWLPQDRRVAMPALRRLHLAAQTHGQALFVLRPAATAQEASPAPLRLLLEQALEESPADMAMRMRILKRRGPPLAQVLALPSHSMAISALLAASRARRAPVLLRPVLPPALAALLAKPSLNVGAMPAPPWPSRSSAAASQPG